MNAGAQVPKLCTQARRNTLFDDLTESLSLNVVKVKAVLKHLSEAVLVFLLVHCLLIRSATKMQRQFVRFTLH